MMSEITPNYEDVLSVASAIDSGVRLLPEPEAAAIIQGVMQKFKPRKTTGHLDVDNDNANFIIPTEDNKAVFSLKLTKSDGDGIVFFEQNYYNRNHAIFFPKLSLVSVIMNKSYSYEYFITNTKLDFIMSLNWYIIAGIGDIQIISD